MHAAGALMCIPIPTPGPLPPLLSPLHRALPPAVICSRRGRLLCTFHWHFFSAAVAFLRFRFRLIFASLAWHTYSATHAHTCDIVDDDVVVRCVCDGSCRRLKFRALFCAKATGNVCAELFWNWNLIMYQQLWQRQGGLLIQLRLPSWPLTGQSNERQGTGPSACPFHFVARLHCKYFALPRFASCWENINKPNALIN